MPPDWDPKSPSLLPTIVCYADILGFRGMTEPAHELGEDDLPPPNSGPAAVSELGQRKADVFRVKRNDRVVRESWRAERARTSDA